MKLSSPASIAKKAARGRTGYRTWRDRLFYLLFVSSVVLGVAGLVTLLANIVTDAWGWLDWQFITSYASRKPELSGIFAPLIGTTWVIVTTALFTIPLGVGTAVYLEEFAGESRFSRLVQLNIANLAGVPSIVYGILGLGIFVLLLDIGRSVLAGGLTLTLLVLPIVIIASQEAIRSIPPSYRDAAYAMGATRWQVVKTIVLPQAIPGIMSGVILALSRAIGEAAPILMISGIIFITFVPTGPGSSFTVLPLQILNWVQQPQGGFQSIAAAAIICLLIMLLSMNAVAIWIRNHYQRSRQ
ncbi:MAG: phosphate ABC transporter permease PstA [Chloroflexi bacterium]|nr:phosphate ABC transporter permease PstA [Chloroflexota bacterium]